MGKENKETPKAVTYKPDSLIKGIMIVSYYRKFIAILFLTNILMCLSLFYMMRSFNRRETAFLNRLKTRDVIVMEGDTVKIAKVGMRGHKLVRKFALDSVKDLLSYSSENYEDAIKTAQMVAIPELARKFEETVMNELDKLKNRGGYYLVKYKSIKVKKLKESTEDGNWIVNITINRIYKNELKEKEVIPIDVKLTVLDTNDFAREDIDANQSVSEIGMLITKMEFNYI